MDYWQTVVYGNNLEELRNTAEAHIKEFFDTDIKEFFDADLEYVLDVRPHDPSGFRNVGDTPPKWKADVWVGF